MKQLINVLFKDNVKFTKFIENKNSFILVSEDESVLIKLSHFTEFFILCSECRELFYLKQLLRKHLTKPYLCKSCNHKGERNPMFGFRFSEEVRKQMSVKRSGENNAFYGKKHTLETKDKISKANNGKLSGDKNPMFGINVYEKILSEQGEDRLNEVKKHLSEACYGEKNGFYGHKHSLETRQHLSDVLSSSVKLKEVMLSDSWKEAHRNVLLNSDKLKKSRLSTEYRNKKRVLYAKCIELGTKPKCCFNPKACSVLDSISEQKGIKIQHAMNGGEFMVPNLGFFVDGYDSENNVVYEYDEKHHFCGSKLIQKDVERQKLIELELNCTFIRLKDEDYKNFLYKTN